MEKVFAFGDSIMKGVIYDGNAYHTTEGCFASLLASEHGLDLVNCAKMGHTILEGMDIFNKRKKQISPGDIILLEYGGNDCDFYWANVGEYPQRDHFPKTDLTEFRESYCRLINMIKGIGARPILFSLPPLESSRYFHFLSKPLGEPSTTNIIKWMKGSVEFLSNWHEQYNLAVFQVAIKTGAPIVDISSPMLSVGDYYRYICQDGIHPNEDGHRLMYEFIRTTQI